MTEQLKNGQVNPQIRRRPGFAVANARSTAAGAFPRKAEDSGSAGAVPTGFAELTQSTHRSRPIGRRRTATGETSTWNSSNGSGNGTGNDATAPTSRGEKARLRTGWELPELIRPLPVRERRCVRKPRLQRHQPAIVEYVYMSRFATASQVQRRFPNWLRTSRTTQWQLANLVQLGFLATTPVRSTSPNFPFVYFATGRGVRLVNETYAAHHLDMTYPVGEGRKASGVAVDSILHELLLTEFELAVKQTVESRPDLALLATERRYFRQERQLRFYQAGRSRRVIPDAGFMIRVGNAGVGTSQNNSLATILNFVELDNGTMPPGRVLEKLQQYAAWSTSESGQKYLQQAYGLHRTFVPQFGFRLLIVVPPATPRHPTRATSPCRHRADAAARAGDRGTAVRSTGAVRSSCHPGHRSRPCGAATRPRIGCAVAWRVHRLRPGRRRRRPHAPRRECAPPRAACRAAHRAPAHRRPRATALARQGRRAEAGWPARVVQPAGTAPPSHRRTTYAIWISS